MPKVKPGEYVTFTKGGKFVDFRAGDRRQVIVEPGDRARVIQFTRTHDKKKIWCGVQLFDRGSIGVVIALIDVPSWWLQPRTILDDLAEV